MDINDNDADADFRSEEVLLVPKDPDTATSAAYSNNADNNNVDNINDDGNIDDDGDDDDNIDDDNISHSSSSSSSSYSSSSTSSGTVDELMVVLQQRYDLPFRQRQKIVELAEAFLQDLKGDIHAMITDQDYENYQGLDATRDTVHEVETMLRVCPEVLIEESDTDAAADIDQHEGECPINCLTYMIDGNSNCIRNIHAVPFVPTFVRLALEYNLFSPEERGGLLHEYFHVITGRYNTLQFLVQSSDLCFGSEHNQTVDTLFHTQLVRLQQMGVLTKEDIQRQNLVQLLCYNDYFATNRFRFLVQWDPYTLLQPDHDGELPLHYAADDSSTVKSIIPFQTVFEYGMLYFPLQVGISLLYTKNNDDDTIADATITPFKTACSIFTRDRVQSIVDDVLTRRYSAITTTATATDADAATITIAVPPLLNTIDALVLAATNETIHLDCVYSLMRREPDVLITLLSKSNNNNNASGEDCDHNSSCNDDDDNNNNNGYSSSNSNAVYYHTYDDSSSSASSSNNNVWDSNNDCVSNIDDGSYDTTASVGSNNNNNEINDDDEEKNDENNGRKRKRGEQI